MSIVSVIYVPEGIAMAADSRLTGYKHYDGGLTDRFTISDNAQKLFLLGRNKVGISFCGDAMVDDKTIGDIIREFEIKEVGQDDSAESIATKLYSYIKHYYNKINTYFYIAGYDHDIPYVYSVSRERINRFNAKSEKAPDEIEYGALWGGGEKEAITKLINGESPTEINFPLMPLRDAIDFAEFLVDITIKYQRFEDRVATCGGPIDLLVITKDYAEFVRHKIFKP